MKIYWLLREGSSSGGDQRLEGESTQVVKSIYVANTLNRVPTRELFQKKIKHEPDICYLYRNEDEMSHSGFKGSN